MSLLYNPLDQFFNNGTPLAGGKVYFYVTGSGQTPLETYSDSLLNNPNPNPIQLDANGRIPNNVWGEGVYKVVLTTSNDTIVVTAPVVGGDPASRVAFSEWSIGTIYEIDNIVTYDGEFYLSRANGNLGNQPDTSNASWLLIKFTGQESTQTTNWNNALTNGFYASNITDGQANTPDNALPGWAGLVVQFDEENISQIVWESGTSGINSYQRYGSGVSLVWSDWVEVLQPDNTGWLVRAGGANLNQLADFDTADQSGSYNITGTTSNGPNGTTTEKGTLLVQREGSTYSSQVFIERGADPITWVRYENAGVFSRWLRQGYTLTDVTGTTATIAPIAVSQDVIITNNGVVTITLSDAFVDDDEIIINKFLTATTLTINTTSGDTITYPDGTTDTSANLSGSHVLIKLVRDGANFNLNITGS